MTDFSDTDMYGVQKYRTAGMRETAPIFTRMGRNFMLWDFLFSDAVIRRGVPNIYLEGREVELHTQAMSVLANRVYSRMGPCSITYGYISPDMSERLVKWKNPKDPSYHRWDAGCSADFVFHGDPLCDYGDTQEDSWDDSPARIAYWLEGQLPMSRVLTYSESEVICLGVNTNILEESDDDSPPRRAFYLNCYDATKNKPVFIKENVGRTKQDDVMELIREHGWKGQGYPRYHGGGLKRTQHVRLGKYLLMSDVLRLPHDCGGANRPPVGIGETASFKRIAANFDSLLCRYYDTGDFSMARVTPVMGYNCSPSHVQDSWYIPDEYIGWLDGKGAMIFGIANYDTDSCDWFQRMAREMAMGVITCNKGNTRFFLLTVDV